MPSLAAWSMVSPQSIERSPEEPTDRAFVEPMMISLPGMGLAVLCIYAGTALALTRRIIGQFDRWLDRPPLSPMPAMRAGPGGAIGKTWRPGDRTAGRDGL